MADDVLFEVQPTRRRRLPARTRARQRQAMPLSEFPPDRQREIAEAVARPRPPDRWIPVGAPGSARPIAYLPSRAWYEWYWQRGVDPDTKRSSLPRRLREAVIERDGMTCRLCGEPIETRTDLHIDHIKPVVHGGTDHIDNLQVAHSWCNLTKGARI